MKTCNGCNQNLELSLFGKDKSNRDGLTHRCKSCRNPQSKAWRLKNPEKVKEINLKNKNSRKEYYDSPERKRKYRSLELKRAFGITADDYDKMLLKQNGVCCICKKHRVASNKYHMTVDHCHKTGKIRGILCTWCNRGIGLFEDNIEFLENAKIYIKGSQI